jgi:hypothetical protein
MRRLFVLSFLVTMICTPFEASFASLVANGDFETVDERIGNAKGVKLDSFDGITGRWDVYTSLPGGWMTSSGPGIEVQYDGVVVDAHSFSHYIELDSHPGPNSNSSMFQDVILPDPGDYSLSFWYHPRTDIPDDNRIDVYFDGQLVVTANKTTLEMNDWAEYAVSLSVADVSAPKRLMFSAGGLSNSFGGLLDDIELVPNPEPATLLLMGAGLFSLAGARRKFRGNK